MNVENPIEKILIYVKIIFTIMKNFTIPHMTKNNIKERRRDKINMGITFINKKTGEEWHRNVSGGNFLSKITFGLWEKIGCYPKSVSDCKIMARILTNRVKLNQYYQDYWEEIFDVKKLNNETIEWMKAGAKFFDNIENIEDLEHI
jgi:hypothetical protein